MPFELKVIAEPGIETECGGCILKGEHCKHFQKRVRLWNPTLGIEQHRRLPECIAAEKAQKGGGDE